MTDKRQTTAYVPPQQMPPQAQMVTRQPTARGEISTGRVIGFLVLAFVVACAFSWVAFAAWGVSAALAVFVVVLLGVFTPYFMWDSAVSSGFMHRRSELSVEMAKIDLATIEASRINEAQEEQLKDIYETLKHFDERIKAVETIRIEGMDGVRHVAKHDNVDIKIGAWLHQTMFDANGMLCGAHKSGHLIGPYPFKGDEEEAQTAHKRLLRAGLVGKAGNNYTWTGPNTLSAAKRQLQV